MSNDIKYKRLSNLAVLLEENPLAYYWMGFLMADGHFDKSKRIKFVLSQKDEHQVMRLASFVGFTGKIQRHKYYAGFSCQNVDIVPKLCAKFGIVSNKTEHPCKLDFAEDDLFLAAFIGFIDGDGCIKKVYKRKDAGIIIKCHRSWLPVLSYFNKRIQQISKTTCNSNVIVNNAGYASINWTRGLLIRWLKSQSIRMKLPVLERKWNLIDLSLTSRQDVGEQRRIKIAELLQKGFSYKDIARQIGITYSGVYMPQYRRRKGVL